MKRIWTGDLAKNQINLPPVRIIIDEVYVRFSLSSAKGKRTPGQQLCPRRFRAEGFGGKVTSAVPRP